MKKNVEFRNNPEMKGIVELKGNIPYAAPGGEQLVMQVLKPQWSSGGKGFPLIVYIEGCGWTVPNQFYMIPQLSALAKRGYVIASLTHRNCFDAPAPAFLQDVKAGLRFLRVHAEEYDIDKSRVAAWGNSSGGNTALLLGLTGDDPAFETDDWAGESTKVQAVVDCFGPTDLVRMHEVQFADNPPEGLEDLLPTLGGGASEALRENLARISPVSYAVPGMEYPPILMLHGEKDDLVLCSDSKEMYRRMEACGYDVELVRVPDAPHGGSFWSEELLEYIFAFIERTLQKSQTTEEQT